MTQQFYDQSTFTYQEWEYWFAWYPVKDYRKNKRVFLKWVWRRKTSTSFPYSYEYLDTDV